MNQDKDTYMNPHRINHPLLIYAFPAIQALPALFIFLGSIPFKFPLEGFFIGAAWFIAAHFLLDDEKVSEIIHRLWSYGLMDLVIKESKTVPNPLKKRYFS